MNEENNLTSLPDAMFAPTLLAWQAQHGRHDLPWQTREAYSVWLSEVMLQQTQVETVKPYFLRFMARFPTVQALAAAPLAEVLALWSGLGYYARARNLHRAAVWIVDACAGEFPRTAAALQALPGVGRSTAAAIAATCFGERVSILDGNVKRVLTRHFGIEGFPGERAVEQRLWALAESLVPSAEVERYPQALMDLGALICTRARPACGICPVAASCVARREGLQAALPTRRPKKAVPEREQAVLVLHQGSKVLLLERPAQGIWGGLFSLPELLTGESVAAALLRCFGALDFAPEQALPPRWHVFTHFRLLLRPYYVEVPPLMCGVTQPGGVWVEFGDLDKVGLPAPIRQILLEMKDVRE